MTLADYWGKVDLRERNRELVRRGIVRIVPVAPDEAARYVRAYDQALDKSRREYAYQPPLEAENFYENPFDGRGGVHGSID